MITPKHGYDTIEKDEYRSNIYNYISSMCDNIQSKKLLFLPGPSDLEIKKANGAGFIDKNMYACDSNAAALATAKWRKQHVDIKIYGNELSRTIERISESGIKIDVANIDYCTNLSVSVFDDMSNIIENIMGNEILIGITMLKGRERSSEIVLARMLFPEIKTADRIGIVYEYILSNHAVYGKKLLSCEYKSGVQTMVYGLYHFVSYDYCEKKHIECYEKESRLIDDALRLDRSFYDIIEHDYDKRRKKRERILGKYWNLVNVIRKAVDTNKKNIVGDLRNYDYRWSRLSCFHHLGQTEYTQKYHEVVNMPMHRS